MSFSINEIVISGTTKRSEFKMDSTEYGCIHGIIWEPADKKAHDILQITHGMTEHMGRYERFAEELVKRGIAVAGFQIPGHGEVPQKIAAWGRCGWKNTLKAMHELYQELTARYTGKHFHLGFSLGSYLLREYLSVYPEDHLDGAILIGTGEQPAFVLSVMKKIIACEMKKTGTDGTDDLIHQLSFGNYNKKFAPNHTSADWLCADNTELEKYLADPLCREDISAGLFYDLISAMHRVCNVKSMSSWKKRMPILLLAGEQDPVGDMGKGTRKTWKKIIKAGMVDVEFHLFPGARHDLLHEYDSGTAPKVIACIIEWIKRKEEKTDEA